MIHVFNCTVMVAFLFLSASGAKAAPYMTTVPVDHIYSPKGFDANDNTQVIVSGYLPDLCYKGPMSSAKVKGSILDISIRAMITDRTLFCSQVIVPFLEAVSVGALSEGDYQIHVNAQSRHEVSDRISVAASKNSSVDEYVYAQIDTIEKVLGTRKIILRGNNPSDCFVFDRLEWISNGRDTYSILPILKKVKEQCPVKKTPIEIVAEVPTDLSFLPLLLHVRTLDGKSFNMLYDEEVPSFRRH